MARQKKEVKSDNWDLVVAGLGKKFGSGLSLFQMDDANITLLEVDTIATRLASLDNALGVFGIPQGRVIEIYGPESSSKTSLALQLVASAQMTYPDRPVLYLDLEHALDPVWMRKFRVRFDNLWVSQPMTGEEATQIAATAIESGHPSLIVLDSVAAIVPKAELEGEMTDNQMGAVGRILGKFFRKTIGPLKKNNVTLLCINQTRSKLGPVPGEERPGGKALRFFASQVMRVRKVGDITNNSEVIGIWVEVQVRKNKVAPPFRIAKIPLLFDKGFSSEMCLIETASEEGIVNKSGSWFSYGDIRLGQGIANATENLTEEQFKEIYEIYKSAKTQGTVYVEQDNSVEQETKEGEMNNA